MAKKFDTLNDLKKLNRNISELHNEVEVLCSIVESDNKTARLQIIGLQVAFTVTLTALLTIIFHYIL